MPEKTVSEPDVNCVFIGKKPTNTYVFSVTTQAQKYKEIKIKARGNSISKAVDVSQIAINRFLTGWVLSKTNIGTQDRQSTDPVKEGEEPRIERVSFIEIIIKRK